MKAMESEVSEGKYLIPSLGFSGADILFANCCFWAQQNGWLEKVASGSMVTNNQNDGANGSSDSGKVDTAISADDEVVPFQLSTKLEAYLKLCRSRPGFLRANELRKNQIYEKKKQHQSRL